MQIVVIVGQIVLLVNCLVFTVFAETSLELKFFAIPTTLIAAAALEKLTED